MELNRDFKGVWFPREIWLDSSLPWIEKILLVEIDSLSTKEKGCFASNEYLAEFLGLSKDRVSKLVSSLKNKGYIEVELKYKKGTRQIEGRAITTIGYRRKCLEGIGKNNEDIYIDDTSSSFHSEDVSNFASDEDKDCICDNKSSDRSDDMFTDLMNDVSDNSKEMNMVYDLIRKGGFTNRIPTNGEQPNKTIRKCVSLIQDIASANFLKWNLDPEWENGNSDSDQLRKVSDEISSFRDAVELVDSVLDDFNKAKETGYYPRDKKVLPKSFVDFLYNEHMGKSWFIHFLVKGYQSLEEVDNAKYVEQLPKEFKHMLDVEGIHWKSYFSRIARNVCDLAEWHERTRNKLDRYTDYSWLFHKEDFWQSYINYVYDLVDGSEGHPSKGHFTPYGKTHQAWMTEMESEYDIDWSALAKVKGEKERGYIEI